MGARRARVVRVGLLVSGIVALIISLCMSGVLGMFFFIMGVIFCISGLAVGLLFWKCPHCGRLLLFEGSLGMKSCPYCGKEID